jgi:hypothetical protein
MFATVVMVAVVAAVLDAEGLKVWAERLEFGATRTAALALAERWAEVGEAVGSTSLRASLIHTASRWTAEPAAAEAPPAPPAAAEPPALQPPPTPPGPSPEPELPLAEPGMPVPDAGTAVAAAPGAQPAQPDAGMAAAALPPPPSPRVVLPPGEEKLDPKEGDAPSVGPREGATVLLLGDSMIGSALGPELARELLKRGGFRVVTAWQPATGLSRGDYYDWGPRMAALMARHKPQFVVVTLGTNDGQDLRGPGRKPVFYGTPGWGPGYEQLVRAAAARLTRGGAKLFWLELPPMRPPVFAKAAREVNLRVARALVGVPSVTRVPVPSELTGANGAYTERTRTEPAYPARASDGVHWSQKAGRHYALKVAELISPSSPASAPAPAVAAPVQ